MIQLAADLAAAGWLPDRYGQAARELAYATAGAAAWSAIDHVSRTAGLVAGGLLVGSTLAIHRTTPPPPPTPHDPLMFEPPGGHHAPNR